MYILPLSFCKLPFSSPITAAIKGIKTDAQAGENAEGKDARLITGWITTPLIPRGYNNKNKSAADIYLVLFSFKIFTELRPTIVVTVIAEISRDSVKRFTSESTKKGLAFCELWFSKRNLHTCKHGGHFNLRCNQLWKRSLPEIDG